MHRVEEFSLPIDVWQTLGQQRKDGLEFAAGADHRYVEAVSWSSETELVVRVWGYGGAKPFDRQLKVKLPE